MTSMPKGLRARLWREEEEEAAVVVEAAAEAEGEERERGGEREREREGRVSGRAGARCYRRMFLGPSPIGPPWWRICGEVMAARV